MKSLKTIVPFVVFLSIAILLQLPISIQASPLRGRLDSSERILQSKKSQQMITIVRNKDIDDRDDTDVNVQKENSDKNDKQSVIPRCEKWCYNNDKPWIGSDFDGKCAWYQCNDCVECQFSSDDSEDDLKCSEFCFHHEVSDWELKCKWDGCLGCNKCISKVQGLRKSKLPEEHED